MIFGHIFCKDHIDMHQQIYGMYLTSPCIIDHIPKVFFQYLFFKKSYHLKTIIPSETKLLSRPKRFGRDIF